MSKTDTCDNRGRWVAVTIAGAMAVVIAGPVPGAQTLEELDAEIQAFVEGAASPGAAVAVVEDGDIVLVKAYGLADLENARPMTADTILRAGSLSKNITSLAILSLVAEGRIDLDAPLADLLPGFEIDNPWAATDPMRLGHLLEHTAGIEGSTYFEYAYSKPGVTPQDYADMMSGRIRVRWPPGWFYSYANPGHTLAALALERACDCRFDDYVTTSIFAPLGMSSSTFLLADAEVDRIALSYRGDGETESSFWLMPIRPSGALLTTARDLARLIQFYATRGGAFEPPIVPPALLERMENQSTSAVARAGMVEGGYGLGNFGFFAGDGHIFHGHTGATDGYRAWAGYDPDRQRGFALMLNADSSADRARLRDILTSYLTRDYPPAAVQAAVEDEALNAYAGWYLPFTHEMPLRSWLWETFGAVRVAVADARLTVSNIRPGAAETELVPVGDGLFRLTDLPIPTAAFVRGPEGDLVYVSGDAYRRVTALRAFGVPVLLITVVSIAAVSIVWALIWLPLRLIGRSEVSVLRSVRLWLLISSGSLVALILLFVQLGLLAPFDHVRNLGRVSPGSLLLLGLSILGALAAILAVRQAWVMAGPNVVRRRLALLPALLTLAAWLYLVAVGWVPLVTFLR